MHLPRRLPRPPPNLSFILLLVFFAQALATPLTLRVPLFSDPHVPLTLRGVDDVGPAFANATEAALTKAESILEHYSDVLRVIAIPTGLAITFFGYFLLGPVLFLAGFISGGGACFVAVSAAIGNSTPATAWISIAAMVLGGAMLGFLALRALSFGMFAVGAALGVVLASALKASLIAQAYPADPDLAFTVAAVVFGLIFGLVALCLQKQMLIFSTAYAGSCACMFGIGHFAGHFPTSADISDVEKGKVNAWILFYIALASALGTAGMFFQFWLGKDKPMPAHAPNDRRRRRRRIVQNDAEDWSDGDDHWNDDVYVERIPLPRAKQETLARPDLQTDIHSNDHSFKADQMPLPRRSSYSQRSWTNIRSAANSFYDDDSAQSSEATNGTTQPERSDQPEARHAVRSNAVALPQESELKAASIEPDLLPDTKVSIDDASAALTASNDVDPLNLGEGISGQGHNHLVHVSLESDVETAFEK